MKIFTIIALVMAASPSQATTEQKAPNTCTRMKRGMKLENGFKEDDPAILFVNKIVSDINL